MMVQTQIENLIQNKIGQQEAFTTADISHPIIEKNPSIRHRQVRDIIDKLWNDGYFEDVNYVTSPITVFPEFGKPQNVRLFHPDKPGFDINSYDRTNQKLNRSKLPPVSVTVDTSSPPALGFDMGDNSVVIASTSSGAKVAAQCEVQQCEKRLNIPRILVSSAGFKTGDKVKISVVNNSLKVERNAFGDQKVDAEGRIRVSGAMLASIGKIEGESCNALLINEHLGTLINPYIEIC